VSGDELTSYAFVSVKPVDEAGEINAGGRWQTQETSTCDETETDTDDDSDAVDALFGQ
jgi:hypothetical protein